MIDPAKIQGKPNRIKKYRRMRKKEVGKPYWEKIAKTGKEKDWFIVPYDKAIAYVYGHERGNTVRKVQRKFTYILIFGN